MIYIALFLIVILLLIRFLLSTRVSFSSLNACIDSFLSRPELSIEAKRLMKNIIEILDFGDENPDRQRFDLAATLTEINANSSITMSEKDSLIDIIAHAEKLLQKTYRC